MKSKPLPERVIEQHVLMYLKSKNIFAWKNVTGGFFTGTHWRKQTSKFAINGTSDVLAILPGGRFLAIELKSRYGKVSPDQDAFIERINHEGGLAFVARDLNTVIQKLNEINI